MGKVGQGIARLPFPLPHWRLSNWQREPWAVRADLFGVKTLDFNAGRGAGKDILAIRCILDDAMKLWGARKKEKSPLVRNPRVKIWVVAPQENNITQTWEDWGGELRDLARTWAPLAGRDEGDQEWLFREIVREGKYVLFGGGEIEIERRLSSTRDALRGPGVDLVHWTEFATETVPGEIQRAYRGELSGTIVRAGRLGRVYRTTTPKGTSGGYWEMLTEEFGDSFAAVTSASLFGADRSAYYRHATSFENEFLAPDQIARIKKEESYGWWYDQERLAKFVDGDKGGFKVFDREQVLACLVASRPKPEGYRRFVCGVDIARMGDDATWFVVVDQEDGFLAHCEMHEKLSGPEVVAIMSRLGIQFPGVEFKVDDTGHRGYIADFAPRTLKIEGTQFSRAKEKWVGGLLMLVQMGRVRIPDPDQFPGLSEAMKKALRELLRQVFAFVKVVKQSGMIEFRHPNGMQDDGVDAWMLATMDLATELQGKMNTSKVREKVRGSFI